MQEWNITYEEERSVKSQWMFTYMTMHNRKRVINSLLIVSYGEMKAISQSDTYIPFWYKWQKHVQQSVSSLSRLIVGFSYKYCNVNRTVFTTDFISLYLSSTRPDFTENLFKMMTAFEPSKKSI